MKRILFVGNGVTLAHVCRPLVLARLVDPARYVVHFSCDARHRALLGSLDDGWREIHTQDTASFLAALGKGIPPYSRNSLCRDAEEDLALLDEIKPDLVIADFRLSMRIATALRGICYASITNTHWSPLFCGRYRLPDMPGAWISRCIGARNAARVAEWVLPLMLRRFVEPMNEARRFFGLPEIASRIPLVYSEADHFIYPEHEHFSPLPEVPSNHHYVGPIVWDPPVDLPDWWSALPDDRPVVYVCMGSSGDPSTLPSIISGLADLPVTTVASTSGGGAISPRHENAFSAPYLPGSRIAEKAALAIGNGGSMMLHQVLMARVPMLAIPSNMDQQMCISPFVAYGAVRELRLSRLTAATVRSATSEMLSGSSYRQAVDKAASLLLASSLKTRFNQMLASVMEPT